MRDRNDSGSNKQEDQRKPYEPPKVSDFGTLSELTFGTATVSNKDGDGFGS